MDFNALKRGDVLKLGYLDNLTGIVTYIEKGQNNFVDYFSVALFKSIDINYDTTTILFKDIKNTISLIENTKEFRTFDISGYSYIRLNLYPKFALHAKFDKHNAFYRAGSKMSIQRKTSLIKTVSELWENKWFIQHDGGWDLNKLKNNTLIN